MKNTIWLILSVFAPVSLWGQERKLNDHPGGEFYGYPSVQLLACQIDGDNSSGYNKFGYQVDFVAGIGLGNNTTMDYSIGISRRGSRRSSDPNDVSVTPFNLSINYLDIGMYFGKVYNEDIHLKLGFRLLKMLSASDDDGYILNPEQNLNPLQMLGDAQFFYQCTNQFGIKGSFQYSLFSIAASSSTQYNWMNSGAALHNNIGLGVYFSF